ncbi:glycoside hydrolase family 31 protein [Acidaminobacter sp. JC074]|uniref:glycoside hydrolase family 31 protein n=1 Tax=Acidaminobacter sp. JC074 TaxID=2530199 RepID=UPI001F0DFD71|nr:TIM-barrel domain-containing protein [Acidaminobacter sp. JC074]MCH4887611.1 glycoside hydrolase family 31 protein [Acidaminobacter sp. JC074]
MAITDVLEGKSLDYGKRQRFPLKSLGDLVISIEMDKELHLAFSSGAKGKISLIYDQAIHFEMYTQDVCESYPIGANAPYMIGDKPSVKKIDVIDQDDKVTLTINRYKLILYKKPFSFELVLEDEKVLANKDLSWNEREIFFDLEIKNHEYFYGTGLRRAYPLNNHTIKHRIEKNTWDGKSVPFYMSNSGYGLFLNTTLWDTTFDFDGNQLEISLPKSHMLDCYIFLGDFKEVLKSYHDLTGKPFMPPKWSLGYWTGRYSYRTQEEVLENGFKFRKKDIPCDLMFLDLMWRGVYVPNEVTDLTWDYDCFPKPVDMINDLKKENLKLFTHVNTTCNIHYKDFSNPLHISKWRQQIMPLIEEGVKGFMVDGGEGKGMNENFMSWNVQGGRYFNGMYPEEMANIWGLLYNKTVIEAMRDQNPDERMFGLTRAATTGSQRYGLIWFGDHECKWEELHDEIMAGMNMSMSGLPFWTMDIGGIQGEPKWDLFIRWLQFGCFVSVTRTHGRFPKEPWLYGVRAESIARDLLNFRMRIMPYIYSMIKDMHDSGLPPVRPMALSYPRQKDLHRIWDQWLFGDNLLVAPVYKEGRSSRHVTLPSGRWLHMATGNIYDGHSEIHVDAPIESIPVFLKEGGILPLRPVCQSVDESYNELTVYVFSDEKGSSYSMYEDDGMTVNYKNEHGFIHFKQVLSNKSLHIDFRLEDKGYSSLIEKISFRCVGDIDMVYVNGKDLKVNPLYSETVNRTIYEVEVIV